MSLREDQVVRYSRQILLPRMGGRGQEQLLATGAQVSGSGRAVAVAAAYLAAGGTAVRARALSSQGFADGSLAALNPDALLEPAAWGALGTPAASFQGSGPWVALLQGGRCLAKLATGCADCFRVNLTERGEPEDGAAAALLGAWGALAFQRAVLGWEKRGLRLWELDGAGLAQELEAQRCERCRA